MSFQCLIVWCSLFSDSHCKSQNLTTKQHWSSLFITVGVKTLSLTSRPQSSGVYCPGPVTFTCVGTEIGTLFWVVNDRTLAAYAYRSDDEFPMTLPLISTPAGAIVQITDASSEMNLLNVTSTFTVDDVTVLNGSSVQCEEAAIESNVIRIFVSDNIDGMI